MSPAAPRWKCPRCGRRFARARQAHSCQVVPLRTHLARGSPAARRIYHTVIKTLRRHGPLQVVPTKSGINLLSRTSLGSIALHRTWVNLALVLTRRLQDRRVAGLPQISPRTFVHRFRLTAVTDVDRDVREWLGEAYRVGILAGRRVR